MLKFSIFLGCGKWDFFFQGTVSHPKLLPLQIVANKRTILHHEFTASYPNSPTHCLKHVAVRCYGNRVKNYTENNHKWIPFRMQAAWEIIFQLAGIFIFKAILWQQHLLLPWKRRPFCRNHVDAWEESCWRLRQVPDGQSVHPIRKYISSILRK